QDRYASPLALAEDLEHWLADEPVLAWKEPIGVRARRWMRRHRTFVTSTAAVFVVAAIGAGFFAAQQAAHASVVERKNLDLAKTNTDLEIQRRRAEDRESQAINAVQRFRDAVAEEPELKNNPAFDALRKRLMKEPMAFFTTLRDQLQADR